MSFGLFFFSYVKYSNVCARALRKCLKPELRADAMKRDDDTIIKVAKWEGGKPVGQYHFDPLIIYC